MHASISKMSTFTSESTPIGQKVTAADNLFPRYTRFPYPSSGQGFLNINFKQCLNKVQAFGIETIWPDVIWCWLAVGNPAQMWGTLDCFIVKNHYQSIERWKTFSHMAKECISYWRIKDLANRQFMWIWMWIWVCVYNRERGGKEWYFNFELIHTDPQDWGRWCIIWLFCWMNMFICSRHANSESEE